MPEDFMLEILKDLQARMRGLQTEVGEMRTDLTERIDALGHRVGALEIGQNILVQDVRLIRGTLEDMGRTRVSVGEIEAIHAEMNRLVRRMNEMEARLPKS